MMENESIEPGFFAVGVSAQPATQSREPLLETKGAATRRSPLASLLSPVSSRQSPNDAVVFDCGEIWRAFEGHGLFGTVSRALSDFGVGIGLNVKQLTLS